MKNSVKFILVVLMTTVCSFAYAQTTYEWQKPPKPSEMEVGIVNGEIYAGIEGDCQTYTVERLYEMLLDNAKRKYGETYPNFQLRNFKWSSEFRKGKYGSMLKYYNYSATVVVLDPKAAANENLSAAIDKALRNVREGSRLAIDQVTVQNGTNREEYKDQVVDVLLDKGYKVVAKEYLEKLYDEQKTQQSGIYNDRTTVQENNFSAVGYFINVKVTESSVRVQVINVSTGEYEGNATITF